MARILIISLALATILNGANYFLQKAGFLNADIHKQILDQRDKEKNEVLEKHQQLLADNPVEAQEYLEKQQLELLLKYDLEIKAFLRSSPGILIFNKIFKYLLVLGLSLYCLIITLREKQGFNTSLLINSLAAYLLILALFTFFRHGYLTAVTGVSIFSFVIIAMIGRALIQSDNYRFLIKILIGTLIVFTILAPLEIIRHVQVISEINWMQYRLSGFMNLPNSMGIYLVCVYCLISNFYLTDKSIGCARHGLITAWVYVCIILTGSYTAMVALIIYLSTIYSGFITKRFTHLLVYFLLLALSLFALLGQADHSVIQSLGGRVFKFEYYLSQPINVFDFLFGQGIGYSSNLLINLSNYFPLDDSLTLLSADSTPLALFMQTGLFGLLLVYGLIITIAYGDSELRSVYITFLICSLTINILEVYPLNLLLGLLVARSLSKKTI